MADLQQKPLAGFTSEKWDFDANGKKYLVYRLTVDCTTKPFTATYNDGTEITQLTLITVDGEQYWMDSDNELLRPVGKLNSPIKWENHVVVDVDAMIVELNEQLRFAAREA